jgi:hypothetical protein
MRYDDNGDGPPPRFGPAGAHRGLPMDPPGYGAGFDDGYDDGGPPSWPTDDGYVLAVPAPLWGGWRGPHQPWRFRRRRPRLGVLAGLARRSTRIGTLRSRRSGAAFPVFAASAGGRRWGLVTRPRRELEAEVHEIVAVRPAEELEFGVRPSPEPIPALPAPPARPGTTADGWQLRLPHQGLHSILSRLRPGDLAKLAGGSLPADPAPTVVRSVARLTAQSKRRGSLRSRRTGQRMELFEAPGYSLLVRPAGEMQGEILAVRPQGELELISPNDAAATRSGQRVRGARAEVKWAPAQLLVRYRHPGGKSAKPETFAGVYIIAKDNLPVYVGQTADFVKEWAPRFHILGVFGSPEETYTVHVGKVSALPEQQVKALNSPTLTAFDKNPDPRLLRQDVEQVLLRYLANSDLPARRNQQSTNAIMSAPAGIELRHTGAVPTFLQRPLKEARSTATHARSGSGEWITNVQRNTQFEVPWG